MKNQQHQTKVKLVKSETGNEHSNYFYTYASHQRTFQLCKTNQTLLSNVTKKVTLEATNI